MKKYFIIGEDMPKTEITETEAMKFRSSDDYRVIVEGDEEKKKPAPVKDKEPDWIPFQFPEKPRYVLVGWKLVVYDDEFTAEIDALPRDAEKSDTPNEWRIPIRNAATGEVIGYNPCVAIPQYEVLRDEACGECKGCTRYTCIRRSGGVRCRNYRA